MRSFVTVILSELGSEGRRKMRCKIKTFIPIIKSTFSILHCYPSCYLESVFHSSRFNSDSTSVMTQKTTTLLFQTDQDLRRFYQTMKANYVEMNIRTRILVCDCNENEIEMAVRQFNAKVVTYATSSENATTSGRQS